MKFKIECFVHAMAKVTVEVEANSTQEARQLADYDAQAAATGWYEAVNVDIDAIHMMEDPTEENLDPHELAQLRRKQAIAAGQLELFADDETGQPLLQARTR